MAALGINLNALIAQFLVFAIVLFVLWRYVYPALLKTLDQRRDAIRVGMENAEKSRQELAEAEKRVAAMLDEARQEAQRTLANATVAAQHVRNEIEQQAQERSRDIMTQAERRIQQEITKARADLRQQVADLAIMAAGKVVGASLDTETNRRLAGEVVAQSGARDGLS